MATRLSCCSWATRNSVKTAQHPKRKSMRKWTVDGSRSTRLTHTWTMMSCIRMTRRSMSMSACNLATSKSSTVGALRLAARPLVNGRNGTHRSPTTNGTLDSNSCLIWVSSMCPMTTTRMSWVSRIPSSWMICSQSLRRKTWEWSVGSRSYWVHLRNLTPMSSCCILRRRGSTMTRISQQ